MPFKLNPDNYVKPTYYRQAEAARRLGITTEALIWLLKNGKIPYIRVDGGRGKFSNIVSIADVERENRSERGQRRKRRRRRKEAREAREANQKTQTGPGKCYNY